MSGEFKLQADKGELYFLYFFLDYFIDVAK